MTHRNIIAVGYASQIRETVFRTLFCSCNGGYDIIVISVFVFVCVFVCVACGCVAVAFVHFRSEVFPTIGLTGTEKASIATVRTRFE